MHQSRSVHLRYVLVVSNPLGRRSLPAWPAPPATPSDPCPRLPPEITRQNQQSQETSERSALRSTRCATTTKENCTEGDQSAHSPPPKPTASPNPQPPDGRRGCACLHRIIGTLDSVLCNTCAHGMMSDKLPSQLSQFRVGNIERGVREV
jgi:hypothetical protein